MKQPVFSIVTITYNAARWLEPTILSVLNQSYLPFEYILIDGGSGDGTVDIIQRYSSRIAYWISEPDKGLYDAMNKGLKRATGDYVWFMNAGDTLSGPDCLQNMVSSLPKGHVLPDILYGETMIVDENGRSLGLRRLKAPEILSWKSFKRGMLVCHQSFVVKRELAPLYDLQYRYSADFDWCIRCMKKAANLYNTHLVLSNFLTGGTSSIQRKASLKERYRIMCKYYGKVSTSIWHVWFAIRFYFSKISGKNV